MKLSILFILSILIFLLERGVNGQQLKVVDAGPCQLPASIEDTIFSGDEDHFNKWLTMIVDAAAAQCPQAQYTYAQVLLKGRNVPVNIPKALKLLEA